MSIYVSIYDICEYIYIYHTVRFNIYIYIHYTCVSALHRCSHPEKDRTWIVQYCSHFFVYVLTFLNIIHVLSTPGLQYNYIYII